MSIERPEAIEHKESKEKINDKLLKFIYRDNHDDRKIVFECTTESIIDADEMYEKKIGKKPEKQSHIARSIQKFNPASDEWEDVWRVKK